MKKNSIVKLYDLIFVVFFICCTYQDKMVRRIEIGKQTDNVIHEHEWIKSWFTYCSLRYFFPKLIVSFSWSIDLQEIFVSHLYCVHKEKTSDTVRKTWFQLGKKEYTDNVYPTCTYLPFFKVLNSDTSFVLLWLIGLRMHCVSRLIMI